MKHTYSITGMTCNSCKQKITEALLAIGEVSKVNVDLERKKVIVITKKYIPLEVLRKATSAAGSYVLSDEKMKVKKPTPIEIQRRTFSDFLPVFVIALAIAVFTTLMVVFVEQSFQFGMRMFMGGFFAVFGAFKIYNLSMFAKAYQTYDIIAKRSKVYAFTYPFLEITLAVLYFTNLGGIYRDMFTLILMLVSTVGVLQKIKQKETIPCACLGLVFKLPMTWVTVTENLLMAIEALVMILLALFFA